ncbi:DUF4397 domain-containing protein [Pedobacter heparinus]|uniref:DUF4397 domain-containing protein n=1 Tax=Pedobacter heparinus (strain ATCC 13125 / DSM 2366 / CIP 104194 / JCM 7457 / NBRC 12017 / NCIMB 9290 / NRRL B-14731 / HIM 762-3) TaxID=485917 RepID=C6XVE7_PEDHD|nr:DUF4397 domain-containing protein [Pedobacter heparinus]ACU04013.1 hypothetical protein Phep_1804 [Pedobacter heparinus DSM 2366]
MKYLNVLIVAVLLLAACKKTEFKTTAMGSLKIVNTVSSGAAVRLGATPTLVNNNAAIDFSVYAGNPDIYVWAVGDSLHPIYNSNKMLAVADRDIYTLFLGGSNVAREAILVKENIPVRSDSTAGVRIINLSPGSPDIKVTLSTSVGVSEFGNIAYKQLTEFKSYPALSTNTAYTFQFRNAATNALISSITMSGATLAAFVPRFRNVTLVLRGVVGGSPAAGVTRVNHYPL